MNPRESVGIALDALRANKLRSFLTLLGVIIGVSSVIAVMSLVQGLDRYVSTRLAAAGSNVFSIDKVGVEFDFTRVREKLRRRDLTVEDAHAIARSATHVEAAVAERTAIATVRRGNRSLERVQVQGVESDYMRVDDLPVERGRPIDPADNRSRAWVCVIGDQVADQLFGTLDPLGSEVRIGGARCVVVGAPARTSTPSSPSPPSSGSTGGRPRSRSRRGAAGRRTSSRPRTRRGPCCARGGTFRRGRPTTSRSSRPRCT